jgi:hypothetical protein
MKNRQKIYIAREYVLTDDYGGVRIDQEAVFTSFEEANNYIEILGDKEAEGEYLLLFRIEIVEYEIGQTESCLRQWTYNIKGELIDIYDGLNYTPDHDYFICKGLYIVGDIVYIVPSIQNKLSPSKKGTYGVVVEVPLDQGGGPTLDEDGEEVRKEYVIYYIADEGLLDHFHVVESALRSPEAGVPNEFLFLELYSKYLNKEIELPEGLIKQLLNEKISVKNNRTFDFQSRTIRGAFGEEK